MSGTNGATHPVTTPAPAPPPEAPSDPRFRGRVETVTVPQPAGRLSIDGAARLLRQTRLAAEGNGLPAAPAARQTLPAPADPGVQSPGRLESTPPAADPTSVPSFGRQPVPP